jgi:ABC-type Fe3+-hydroxamate transport system substrate-binding protein
VSRLTRRSVLRTLALGTGGSLFLALIEACTPPAPVSSTSVPTSTSPAVAPGKRTIRDMLGRSVQVPATVNRVATNYPIVTQMVHMLGSPDKLVGIVKLADPTFSPASIHVSPRFRSRLTGPRRTWRPCCRCNRMWSSPPRCART